MIVELKQRHIEAFYANVPEKTGSVKLFADLLRNSGQIVKAARAAGWFDPDPGDVDELKPGIVNKLAIEVSEAYGKALTIDPN